MMLRWRQKHEFRGSGSFFFKIIFLVFHFAFSQLSFGQGFEKYYPGVTFIPDNERFKVIACSQGGYLAVVSDDSLGFQPKPMLLLKLSENEEMVWARKTEMVIDDLVEVDDGYLICGTSHSDWGSVMKITFSGAFQWVKKYPQIYYSLTLARIEGGFLFGGNKIAWDSTVLIKGDLNGNTIWSKAFSFDSTGPAVLHGLVTGDGGHIYMAWEQYQARSFISKISSAGDPIISFELGLDAAFRPTLFKILPKQMKVVSPALSWRTVPCWLQV